MESHISAAKRFLHVGYIFASGIFIAYQVAQLFLKKRQISNSEDTSNPNSAASISQDHKKPFFSAGELDTMCGQKLPDIPSQSPSSAQDVDSQKQQKVPPLVLPPQSTHSLPPRPRSQSIMSLKELGTPLPESIVEMEQRNITKVCLTGGPCAGKTSGLAYLSEKLRDDDINVFMVPEAATMLANGGGMLDFAGYSAEDILAFQKVLMKAQISLEDSFYKLAQLSKAKSIMLCDRGLLDGKAFLSDEEWDKLMKDMKFTEKEIRDQRYDTVIHMVTAADGAEGYYTVEGARFQNAQEAVKIDKKFQDAWLGHQQLEVIDNRSVNGFEEKLNKLLFTVRKSSGLPVKGKKLHKRFVIGDPELHPNLPDDLQVESFDIEDSFLYNPGHDEKQGKLTKVRKRIHKGEEIYLCSESHVMEGKNTMFFKKRLNYREYLLVKDRQDRERVTIRKNRRQFIYQGYFYALDKFKDFDMCILRLKNSSEVDSNLEIIPDFLQVDADITNVKEFKSVNLSLKSSPLRHPKVLEEIILQYYEQQKHTFTFTNQLRPRK